MLYEIFQYIKDLLAEFGNVPKSCICAICLTDFEQIDKFIRLECYHYFHVECLVRHFEYAKVEIEREHQEALRNKIKWLERKISCPTCREPLKSNELNLLFKFNTKNSQTFIEENFIPIISTETRQLQQKMKLTFEKQKLIGGIIDTTEKPEEIIVLSVGLLKWPFFKTFLNYFLFLNKRPNANEVEKNDSIELPLLH
jgi:E3 ubiquitin-protein ligase RNF25